jgi:hypothetical protein
MHQSSTVAISFVAAKVEKYDPTQHKKVVSGTSGAATIDVKLSWVGGRWLTSQVSLESK